MASVDAQRLIALSIGKLQASRSQRGGIDLHKNLLVSHVLYTARTALLTGMVPEYYRAETTAVESDIEEDETVDCGPETAEETVPVAAESTEYDSALPSGEGEEKDLCTLTPVVDLAQPPLTSASGNVDSRLDSVTLADSVDKENLSTEQQQNVATSLQPAVLGERCTNVLPTASCDEKRSSAAPCSCCRKRKQSETEAACDSISPKKRRIEKQETDSETTDSWETTEDMCTDSPVSSLVNIFNSGFKGLVHSSIELESEPTPQQAVPRSGPNSSKQGLQQCMQEVVTSIGTLARPIVAF